MRAPPQCVLLGLFLAQGLALTPEEVDEVEETTEPVAVPPPPINIYFGEPYTGEPFPIPGVVQAEMFNVGPEAYFNFDLGLEGFVSEFRAGSPVEITAVGLSLEEQKEAAERAEEEEIVVAAAPDLPENYKIDYIVPGEFLSYEVLITEPGDYSAIISTSAVAPQKPFDISLKLNDDRCGVEENTLVRFQRRIREIHTADPNVFIDHTETFTLPEDGVRGEATITVCFNDVENITFDKFELVLESEPGATFAPTLAPPPYTCMQDALLPGVKPGSCLQVLCFPDRIAFDEPFHATVTWCLDRARPAALSFDTLDNIEKFFISYGEGGSTKTFYDDEEEAYQCGINTFEITLPADLTIDNPEFSGDVMYKYFITPIFYGDDEKDTPQLLQDPFPNMLAEAGWNLLPDQYGALEGDCPVVDFELWNLTEPEPYDAIDIEIPECHENGKDLDITFDVELNTIEESEITCNLMGGQGVDVYLSEEEIFVAQAYMNVEGSGRYTITIPGELTEGAEIVENPYVSCWLGKPGMSS
ncbi:unnamed protein product [Chrysoparadoxa australica]